jgi:hypothetical protein
MRVNDFGAAGGSSRTSSATVAKDANIGSAATHIVPARARRRAERHGGGLVQTASCGLSRSRRVSAIDLDSNAEGVVCNR